MAENCNLFERNREIGQTHPKHSNQKCGYRTHIDYSTALIEGSCNLRLKVGVLVAINHSQM